MTSAEHDILELLLRRLDSLRRSLADDLSWMGEVPETLAEFDSMESYRRSASKAVLKSFEQIEDQLARAFRLLPKLMLADTTRWYARDYGDFMEKLGVIDSAAKWSEIVRLRNELVHDYPLDPQIQFDRFKQAVASLPALQEAHRRLVSFVQVEFPRKA